MSDTGSSFGGGGRRKFVGAGGTPGGVGEFLVGVIMAVVGTYMLLNQVEVHTSVWRFGGYQMSFGVTLIPLLLGVGILFFNGRSVVGWLLTAAGLLIVIAGILMNMDIYFRRTSLFHTLLMLGLMAGGVGLVVRGLRPHRVRGE